MAKFSQCFILNLQTSRLPTLLKREVIQRLKLYWQYICMIMVGCNSSNCPLPLLLSGCLSCASLGLMPAGFVCPVGLLSLGLMQSGVNLVIVVPISGIQHRAEKSNDEKFIVERFQEIIRQHQSISLGKLYDV
ncbi:hypothetical protein CAPTEDRAFT_190423, partial [Capitella teleta]